MSFQGYLDNIAKLTGKTAEDFKELAEKKGLLLKGEIKDSVKATHIVDWLKKEYKLGHGHAMSIYAYFKGMRGDKKVAATKKKVVKKAAKAKSVVKRAVKKVARTVAAKKTAAKKTVAKKSAAVKKTVKKAAKKVVKKK